MVDFRKHVIVSMENEQLIISSISPECDHFLRTHPHLGIRVKMYIPSIGTFLNNEDNFNKIRKNDDRFTDKDIDELILKSLPPHLVLLRDDE